MWWRKAKAPPSDAHEAHEAQARAQKAIEKVQSQETEVQSMVSDLERRRTQNNFGRSLVIAMELRGK